MQADSLEKFQIRKRLIYFSVFFTPHVLVSGDDPISQDMSREVHKIAANLNKLYIQAVQKRFPNYDPNSPAAAVGRFGGEILAFEGPAIISRVTKGI